MPIKVKELMEKDSAGRPSAEEKTATLLNIRPWPFSFEGISVTFNNDKCLSHSKKIVVFVRKDKHYIYMSLSIQRTPQPSERKNSVDT